MAQQHRNGRIKFWLKVDKLIIDQTNTTKENSDWKIESDKPIQPGWYKITAETKDKWGNVINAESYIQLTSVNINNGNNPLSIITDKSVAEPLQRVNVTASTSFNKIWLIRQVNKVNKVYNIDIKKEKEDESVNEEGSLSPIYKNSKKGKKKERRSQRQLKIN